MTILVATGLHKEAGILAGPGVVVVAGGGDGARLERELEAAAKDATAILSCGLAGALAPELKAGDLVLGSLSQREREGAHAEGMGRVRVTGEVEPDNHPHPSAASRLQHRVNSVPRYSDHAGGMIDPMLSPAGRGNAALIERLATQIPSAQVGTITGSDTIVATAAQKQALHAKTGALAVDMESHIAARVAARHNLPFAIIRVISDSADEALPPAALAGMKPDGSMALGAVLASLARNPAQLPALIRTGIHAGRAFAELRRVRDVLGSLGVGLADDLQLPLDMR
ncbi:hypothetical protein GCM10009087_36920 [Sphingomonas oligophenolica]|uniref:Phosphorylase n=1 Tax=Sphingomonas oligophenolica TaxID=301154 RepID=A0ABU9YAI9_9SPHN